MSVLLAEPSHIEVGGSSRGCIRGITTLFSGETGMPIHLHAYCLLCVHSLHYLAPDATPCAHDTTAKVLVTF